ncbi:MAG: hypothetical protein JO110_25680 [Acetobacteraceae bacterium]|nr:hypothetical protein [Acetobacteraceae bacterium]
MTRNPFLVAFMAPTPPPLPTGLSDRLALIIAGLRGVLAAHMAKDRSAVYGSQVQYLLADPEMVALLADVPEGGPILRPLCRMLGIRLGPELGTKRRGGSASAASPRDSEGQPDASATGGVPPASHAGLPPSGGLEALPSPPELPGPGGAGATITAPSRLRDGNPVGAGADPPLAGPTPA